MLILLTRDVFTARCTLGTLEILYDGGRRFDGERWVPALPEEAPRAFGYTCEDHDRGLCQEMPLERIHATKIPKQTAIPSGRYRVRRTHSPRFGRPMMEVLDVPGYHGIRIHPGNTEEDTEGCLLPGTHRDVAGESVLHSRAAWEWLDARVAECEERGEDVFIHIARHRTVSAAS